MRKNKKININQRFGGLLPVVIDLETTGVNPNYNAILEISSLVLHLEEGKNLRNKDFFSCHVKPFSGYKSDSKAMNIHSIDTSNPLRLAISEKEALNRLFRFIYKNVIYFGCKKAVLVGQNASFDLSFLEAARKRHGIDSPLHPFTVLDTATLSAIFYGKTVLCNAVYASNIEYESSLMHSAIYDTKITSDLFCNIVNDYERMLKIFSKKNL